MTGRFLAAAALVALLGTAAWSLLGADGATAPGSPSPTDDAQRDVAAAGEDARSGPADGERVAAAAAPSSSRPATPTRVRAEQPLKSWTITGIVARTVTVPMSGSADGIAGASVLVSLSDSAEWEPVATTDARGAFSVTVPAGERVFLAATAVGYLPRRLLITGAGGVQLQLHPGGEESFVVQTESGAPIAGAVLECRFPTDVAMPSQSSKSDKQGLARLLVVVPGEVTVRAEGFASLRLPIGDLAAAPDVVLRPPASIAGVVVDARGRPVDGARVHCASSLDDRTTDESGRFAFQDVDPATPDHSMTVMRDGFVAWQGSASAGTSDAVVRLSRPCAVEGTASFADGTPLEGGRIDAAGVGADFTDGRFRLAGLSAGEFDVRVSCDSDGPHVQGQTRVRLADGETLRDVRIAVQEVRRSWLVVRIVGADGTPARFTVADALPRRNLSAPAKVPVTGQAPGAPTTVTASKVDVNGVVYGSVAFEVATRESDGGEPDVVTLPRLRPLVVAVTLADGSPAGDDAALKVSVVSDGLPAVWCPADAEQGGRFRCGVAEGQSCRLWVRVPGEVEIYREATAGELAAGFAEVRLGAGVTVRVHVMAAPPGRISEPWFGLTSDTRSMGPAGDVTIDGRYVIEHVPPGKWQAWVMSCGSIVEKTIDIDVPETGEVDLGDVVLPGTTTLHGRVVTADGRPADGAAIAYCDARRLMDNGGINGGVEALTGIDGTFDLDVPIGATGDLSVEKAGCGGVVVPLDGTPAPLDVRLGVACTLRVDLHGPTGRVPSGSIVVMRPGGTAKWTPQCDVAEQANSGSATHTFRGLAPGKWVVRVGGIDPEIDREVTLVAGETTAVSIDER